MKEEKVFKEAARDVTIKLDILMWKLSLRWQMKS